MIKAILQHHILANLAFVLVMVVGWMAYFGLPREQDPTVNFNWVQIISVWPGAAAEEVEKQLTDPLEEGLSKVADVKFLSSTSREGMSSILVRFNEIDDDTFRQRVADVRREIQNQEDELPEEVDSPSVLEITSANAFPTATLVIAGAANDEVLRKYSRIAEQDIESWAEVDRADSAGRSDPELLVHFSLQKLAGTGVTPAQIADTVAAYFRDLAAGSLSLGDQKWLVRLIGTDSDPGYLGDLPVITAEGEVPLRSLSVVKKGAEDPQHLVYFEGRPAVLISVYKRDKANNLELLDRLRQYIAQRNASRASTGIEMILADDQTVSTRQAIRVMQNNALIGLMLVLLVTWAFLGFRIAFFTGIGIPFVLAGTFFLLHLLGQTLNVTVLLGVVISLGMLVDDAVVVVEALYYHLRRGLKGVEAATLALRESVPPVTAAVLTTIAAFLPLMLLPGLLGDFMRVVPVVVTAALLISLLEAFWILPIHVIAGNHPVGETSSADVFRRTLMQKIRHAYTRSLLRVLRRPKRSLTVLALLGSLVVGVLAAGWVKMDFFASDLYRLFYVNVAMPAGTSLAKTGETLLSVEQAVRKNLRPDETRAITTYAGLGFTEKEPVVGEHMGQILVTLQPGTTELRSVDEVIDALREGVANVPGPVNVSYMRRKTGPPTSKPINVKVRGDNLERIRSATELLTRELEAIDGVRDIADDDAIGKKELRVRLNPDAITRAGLNPADVARIVRLYAAGEIVAETQHEGKKLQVRVRADPEIMQNIEAFLDNAVPLADGAEIALRDLLYFEVSDSLDAIRHHNQRRAITIEGDIDSEKINTVEVNNKILRAWNEHKHAFPDIDIDLSGEIDDIREGLASMGMLFVVGLALMFLILGTQFNSYTQPMIVLTTVPMAFIGVVLGLLISGHPVSLYTLYGVIALAGIAANDAIVLISTANRKAARGLPRAQALAYASRRRVIPIVITSLTTIAGLFSLAAGIGGESLLWGPVATSIVWGLAFSTVLTLYFIPVVYLLVGSVGRRSAVDMLPPPSPSFFEKSGVGAAVWRYLVRPLAGRHAIADREDLRLLVREPIQLAFYEDGRQAYQAGDYEKAIRVFEDLAVPTDASGLLCALASQANVKYMQVIGWDAGYGARARRFLDRARSCRPNDRRLQRLEVAMQALDAGDELAVEHAV